MQEDRRRSCTSQGRGDFGTNNARFADSRNKHLSATCGNNLDRAYECSGDVLPYRLESLYFNVEDSRDFIENIYCRRRLLARNTTSTSCPPLTRVAAHDAL